MDELGQEIVPDGQEIVPDQKSSITLQFSLCISVDGWQSLNGQMRAVA